MQHQEGITLHFYSITSEVLPWSEFQPELTAELYVIRCVAAKEMVTNIGEYSRLRWDKTR